MRNLFRRLWCAFFHRHVEDLSGMCVVHRCDDCAEVWFTYD
jgi:hypothetical protein